MRTLTANELGRMQDVQEVAMPDTCIVRRRTLTSDDMGGYTEAWADVGEYSCRIVPKAVNDEREQSGKVTARAEWAITLPYNADVRETDRIQHNDVYYEVVQVHDDESWQTALHCVCWRVE